MLRLLLTSWLKNVSWICITTAVTLVAADGEYTYAVQDNCKLVCFDSNRFGLCTIPADLGPVTANQANERRATDAASTEKRRDMRKRLLAARLLAVQTLLGRLKKKKQKNRMQANAHSDVTQYPAAESEASIDAALRCREALCLQQITRGSSLILKSSSHTQLAPARCDSQSRVCGRKMFPPFRRH